LVQSGDFAREWIKASQKDILEPKLRQLADHQLEKVGKEIRKMSGLEK
jgi:ketol-acid reductoisomerase